MSLYLCCDCGGSKTSAVICDPSGKIVGRAVGGPSNFAYHSLEAVIAAIRAAVTDALKECPSEEPFSLLPSPSPFAAAWFGISGIDSPVAIDAISPALSTLLGIPQGPRLMVANDTHLLAAPVRMHPDVSYAVTVIAGTGSNVVSFRESSGSQLEELGRIGGWGWILGDEGGGFHVGKESVRRLLIEHDSASVLSTPARESSLKQRVLEAFGVKDVLDLLTEIHVPPPSAPLANTAAHRLMPREKRLSSLAPLVFKSAFEDHDALAIDVLQTCSGILASQIAVLLGERSDGAPRLVRAQDAVICFGGSLVGVEAYRNMVLNHLSANGHTFAHVEFVDDAAATGAIGLVKT
ncbi:uncharacterized protein BT62DRAFT_1073074 [Guyanagaster necrorhizus]|uniref:N-acetyl-D-glucosamine kinase n=1 Tax=Guyanagaster necrorhizus TaxID=856835 RepID=A0A9P7VYQ1_9AGAR|nr:uncharacterized protein BT62DRAFT_1073074 [Guyanagaster necrorhizus MCA 3950]KAG7449638.1 hypothetical protein BT62DRAFT_1073074 [Guyanagaster necrorhizus MCA 3950]